MKGKIISIYPYMEVAHTRYELEKLNLKSTEMLTVNYSITRRVRNDEELEKLRNDLDKVPRLLPTDYFFNKEKDKIIYLPNDNFEEDYLEVIDRNLKEYDFIFIDTYSMAINVLMKNHIHFHLIYPDILLKNEYIGKNFQIDSKQNFACKELAATWNSTIKHFDELEPNGTIKKICIKEYNTQLFDVIKENFSLECIEKH